MAANAAAVVLPDESAKPAHAQAKLSQAAYDRKHEAALLSPEQAADYLLLSISTLARWRIAGKGGPVFVRVSPQRIGYRRADLDKFIEERVRTSTSQE